MRPRAAWAGADGGVALAFALAWRGAGRGVRLPPRAW